MKKRKVKITNTGYLPNSPDRNNPMNIIPSNQITMKNVPFPILGVDNMGNRQMMMPGGEYSFPGQYVTEIPMGKYQKGGLAKYQKKGQVNPKSKGWREYKTPTGESLYLDPRFKDQRYYVNEKGDHITPDQNMSLYDVNEKIWESGTSLPTLNVSPRYKYEQRPGALGAMETIRVDLDNNSQQTISPDVMATKREMDNVVNSTINPAGLALQGALNMAQGNILEGGLQTALSIPVVGQAVGKVIGAPFKFIGNELASTYGPALSEVGRLATTKTPLKNAYKFNPYSNGLGQYNRVVGRDAIDDALESGVIRSGSGQGSLQRPTPYPSFTNGLPSQTYIDQVNSMGDIPYIISTNRPMGVSTLGRHGKGSTYFPIGEDYVYGSKQYLSSFPIEEAKLYNSQPHWWKGYEPVEVPKPIDWGKEYFYKLELKDKELQKLVSAKKITNKEYTESLRTYKEALARELGTDKKIGSGAYGSVYTLQNKPDKVIKIGMPMSRGQGLAKDWTPDVIEDLKFINKNGNIAIPEKAEYYEVPSVWGNSSTTPQEVLYMRNLNIPQIKNLGLNKRDRYAYFLKQARQLRDKGVRLDYQNPDNFKFNENTGIFDIYDINPYHIENPVQYMQVLRDATRGPLFEHMRYKQGGIYMGDYEFKDGGLVKYQKKGEVSFDEYMMEGLRPRPAVQESTYRSVPIIEQAKKEEAEGITTKQKVQAAANRKKIVEEEKKEEIKKQLLDQGEIKPATEGTERLKNQFVYAMDQPLDAMGSLMQRGYVPQGNLNGDYETASPMSSVIGAFNPASVIMDVGRVGRDAFEKETYTTLGGAGEAGLNVAGFLPFGDVLKKAGRSAGILSDYRNIQQLRLANKFKNYDQALERMSNDFPDKKSFDQIQKESKNLIKKYGPEFEKKFGPGADYEILMYGAHEDLKNLPNQNFVLSDDPFARSIGLNNNLTNQQKFLGDAYQYEFSGYFNNRKNEGNENFAKYLSNQFEPVITANKIDKPVQVKRASSFNRPVKTIRDGQEMMMHYDDLQLGDVIYPEHNWSTSSDLKNTVWGSDRSKVARINLPKDQSVFRPNMFRGREEEYIPEQEVLLPSKLGYKVTGNNPQGLGDNSPRFIFDVVNPYKQGGMYLGKYEFKDGGLVKLVDGGKSSNDYAQARQESMLKKALGLQERIALQKPEPPLSDMNAYLSSKLPALGRLKEEAQQKEVETKYSNSPVFQSTRLLYNDPAKQVADYEKSADYKLRFKDEKDYNEEDIKSIQNSFKNSGVFQSKELDPQNYKTEEEVIELQKFLAQNGLMDKLGKYGENKDGIDGKLGKNTREAIRLYNEHNKPYKEGVLDDPTKKAIKDFKNQADAKKTLGLRVSDDLNQFITPEGEADISAANQALQDFESQLNSKGYFKGANFKTDEIKEFNPRVAFKFKLNPDSKTPFGMCAQYVNGTICDEDAAGFDAREELGLSGSAWHISDNIQSKGGKSIFAGLPQRKEVPNLKTKDEIANYIKSNLNNQKENLKNIVKGGVTWDSSVKPGDVVNIFYEGSNYTEEAYNQTKSLNNRLFTTHVGVVKADDKGNLFVEHNVHGKVEKDKLTDFLEGKVKGNGKNKVSMISGITRPNYYMGALDDGSGIPEQGITYYQTEYGKFNPKGAKAREQYDGLGESISNKVTYKFLKTIENNRDQLLKDIPISENEFDKLMRVSRAIPTLETYGGKLTEEVSPLQKTLQDTFLSDREKSMGLTKLKDETNLGQNLRSKLISSDYELDKPEKAALPTFYKISKDYLYLKEIANKNGIRNITADQLAKLAGLSYNQSVGKIAKDLIDAGSYDNYINNRKQQASSLGKSQFRYEGLVDVYDNQTMKRGGGVKDQGIYLGKYEFKDGGLVKYQDKGEVNMYELERRAKAMGHNSIEDYRNANWRYGENHPKIVKLKQEYPYTWKLAKGLPSVERYKEVSPTQWFDMLDMIAQAESKNKNIRQGNDGPGRGYYQFEAPSTTTAKNRAIQIKKDLKSLGYDLQVPERFDTNFMNLSKDEQAFYALSNLIKGASAKREGDPNYKIDLTNPGKAWFDLHWAGAEKHPEDVNDRIAHWNESNPNYKIGFDKNGELFPIKGYGGITKAQKGKEYKTPTGQSIYLDPNFKTYARYKDENGNVIPTTELQKYSMIYDPQANTWDATHSEKPLQIEDRRLTTEDRINKWLGYPMDKAVKVAEELSEAGEDPIDNIRHPLAGMYAAQAIANKTGNIPYISPALGWLGSNAMGIGHEIGTIFRDSRPLKEKGREALEDIFNNNAGATMSLMPIPDAAKEEALIQMSFKNKLPDGIVDPKGRDFYFKQSGGSVRKVKIKRAPRKNQ